LFLLELNHKLFQAGINRYQSAKATEDYSHLRYPVFVKVIQDHAGSHTAILHDESELEAALEKAVYPYTRHTIDDLMIVEYQDTSVDGQFTKYASFKFAGKVMARSRRVASHWMMKAVRQLEHPDLLLKEQEFLENNTHAEEIGRMFELAGIDYGRIDCAFVDGQMQVWEINTNPMVTVKNKFFDAYARKRTKEQLAIRKRNMRLFLDQFTSELDRYLAAHKPALMPTVNRQYSRTFERAFNSRSWHDRSMVLRSALRNAVAGRWSVPNKLKRKWAYFKEYRLKIAPK